MIVLGIALAVAAAFVLTAMWPWLRERYRESERASRARCRQLDIEILWPSLCDLCESEEHARLAFGHHAHNDQAWTADYNELEIYVIIQSLQMPS